MNFEWDPRKAALNKRKHGVSFEEAATAFGDPLALTFADPDHSDEEHRFLTFGRSRRNWLLIVIHTDRPGVTRIISARKMEPSERRTYQDG
jgi:uncharacterized DUF497 family protein